MQSTLVAGDGRYDPLGDRKHHVPTVITVMDQALHAPRRESIPLRRVELPFTVRLVRTEAHLLKAVQVRAEAFKRHAPKFAAQLVEPEAADRAPGNVILLAESKSTGAPEGSVRLETNFSHQTELESVVELPEYLKGRTIAQASRLAVRAGPGGPLIRMALVKAVYRYCLATQIDFILIAARSPVDRKFISLGFRDVFTNQTAINFPSQGDKLLRLFSIDIVGGERRWKEIKHPFYKFMMEDYHPDIEIFDSVRGMWSKPRSRRNQHPLVDPLHLGFEFPVV